MLSTITSFFDNFIKPVASDTNTSTTNKLHLACAALLLELCVADHAQDEKETQTLLKILRTHFLLDDKQLNELWLLAQQEKNSATSLFQFTSLINTKYDQAAKTQLLKHMWEVAYADGRLDRYEEHMIRQVADLLYLSHSDFIRTKLASKPQ